MILGPEGLSDVQIEGTPGELTDHYDPRTKKLAACRPVWPQQPSVAALAIVAHEIGHALQDHQGYAPLKLRGAIVPAVQVSSWVAPILFFIGLLLGMTQLAWLGVHSVRRQRAVRADHAARGVRCQPPGAAPAADLPAGRWPGAARAPSRCWMRPR